MPLIDETTRMPRTRRHLVIIDERSHVRWNVANLGAAPNIWIGGRADGRGPTIQAETLSDCLTAVGRSIEGDE